MTRPHLIAERRIWSGHPGVELSVSTVRLQDGTTRLVTGYVDHTESRPTAGWQRDFSLATGIWLADAVQSALALASERIETDGEDHAEDDWRCYAEALTIGADRGWLRLRVGAQRGRTGLWVDQGTADDPETVDVVLVLPFVRALELRRALASVTAAAFAQEPLDGACAGGCACDGQRPRARRRRARRPRPP